MEYPEDRVQKAITFAVQYTKSFQKGLANFLHWHCRQKMPPLPSDKPTNAGNADPGLRLALEYNAFLKQCGYNDKAIENENCFTQGHIWVVDLHGWTTLSLKNFDMLRDDLTKSRSIIANQQKSKETPS